MRKVCVVTGTRAEYGLLYWLMREIGQDLDLQLQLIVTGMHLSPEFGLTYKEIEREFSIDRKIEMLLSSDTSVGITKSMGLAQISFAEAFDELKPDIVVLLGDRYEIFSAASAALITRVPIAHIHGGETTEGAFDESIRHAITKMSHLHFTAAEAYRTRVIQLGESPDRVLNVGGMGVENIKRLQLLSEPQLEEEIGFKFLKKKVLVTFHPVTLEDSTAQDQFQSLLNALDCFDDISIVFTKANSDTDGRIINKMIDDYVLKYDRAIAFVSMGQLRYLSMLQISSVVLGNSSSGLLEAPSFKVPTINIGDRQKGRLKAASVVDCLPEKDSILEAFRKIDTAEFKADLQQVKSPYGDGSASGKIVNILKEFNLRNAIKKHFYDL